MATLSIPPNPDVTFGIEYLDDDLVIVTKRAGLVTQPGKGHETDALLNGLFDRFGPQLQNLGRDRDFGLLHRLDRETSGLLVVALKGRAYDALREQFAARAVRKYYWALVAKTPKEAAGVINKPIAEVDPKRPGDKKLAKIASPPLGKPAVTAWRVVQGGPLGALLECRPLTGRLHQVRVHLEAVGCPIMGDGLYAPASVARAAPRLGLHAHRLAFDHPTTGQVIDVRTPFPKDLRSTLRLLRLDLPTVGQSSRPAEPDADDSAHDPAEPD
ncbi:MAG: RluA family pseudouridine synthase [Planctomycetaceae bacterium]|jgi:23S rRNA pseudouridine1911/1915/1917 synthase|nr:RluA family pseudouridine synthase [Phycisphaerales bacterium]MCE2652085.1 RluA family pseudouridine synthase [Planctomycetaceae bacterium]